MSKRLFLSGIAALFTAHAVVADAQRERDFYTETWGSGVTRNLTQYGAKGDDKANDSGAMQRAIDELANLPNGGRINIPAGDWYLGSIQLKSKVHLAFDKDATVFPVVPAQGANSRIFALGWNGARSTNVSIRGVGGKFRIDLRNSANQNITPIDVKNARNFLVSNVHVVDNHTVHATMNFGYSTLGGKIYAAQNGLIKNISNERAHGGYGLVQVRLGNTLLFKGLRSSSGGVTLRLESDPANVSRVHNQASPKLNISNVVGRNIFCRNGNAAVMLQPWTIDNGKIDVSGVRAVSCFAAVRVDRAFTPRNAARIGSFAGSSVVKNINATYGTNAQVKDGSLAWLPAALRKDHLASRPFNWSSRWFKGPSSAPVVYRARGAGNDPRYYAVKIESITANNYRVRNTVTYDDRNKL